MLLFNPKTLTAIEFQEYEMIFISAEFSFTQN